MTDLRLDARWVVPIEPAGALPDHSVIIHDDTIVDLLPTAEAARRHPEATVIDLGNQALIPGLVNTHTHAAMTLLRGWADDLHLMDWLQRRIWPAEAKWVDADFVADGTRLACLEMVLGGTTLFNDMYFFQSQAIDAAVAAGIRIVSGITYVKAPTRYATTEQEYLDRGFEAVAEWRDHPLVGFCFAPHSTYATSEQSWHGLAERAERLGFGIHVHVNETQAEVDQHLAAQGKPVVEWLAERDVLSPRFLAAHAVHMTDREVELLAEAGASVAHCPSSNLKLASGFAPVWKMIRAGVNVSLGTDGAASNNRLDMWQEMRTATLLAKAVSGDGSAVSAQQALAMATINGARALGWDRVVGSITPGKRADLVAVDLSSPLARPHFDPISHLVYVASRHDVISVWVAGRQVVRDRRCITLDVPTLLDRVDRWAEILLASDAAQPRD